MNTIHVVCPKCGHQFPETFVRLRSRNAISCSKCGESIEYQQSMIGDAQKQVEGAFRKLNREITKLNQRPK